jgi:hypothetical protein
MTYVITVPGNKTDLAALWGYSEIASRPLVKACASRRPAASIVAVHAHTGPRVTIMSKIQRSNKETKKQSTLTPKEKKAAKRDKKKSGGHVPFVVKDN